MNPITALRSMLESIAEGTRVQQFGYGYKAKEDFTKAETAARLQESAEKAALHPSILTRSEMEAKKALFERAQRIEQAKRRGFAGDDDGAAQGAADMANREQDLELEAKNAQIERDKTATEGIKQKLPAAVAAISEGTARKLRGMRAGDVGAPEPFTNDELDTVMNLRDDEQRAREAALMRQSLERRAEIGATARRGSAPVVGDLGLSVEAQNVIGSAMMRLSKPKQVAFSENVRRLAGMGAQGEPELKRIVRQAAVEGLDVGSKREVQGRQVMAASLNRAREILTDMAARGVPTGWLQGTAEDLLRRVGETGNPELVRLGTELDSTLIQYRHDMTGAAFGAREEAAYAKQLPNYRNTLPVNLGVIDGMLNSIETQDRVFWEDTFGPDGAVFAGAVEAPEPTGADVPIEEKGGLAPHSGMKLLHNKRTGEYKWVDR